MGCHLVVALGCEPSFRGSTPPFPPEGRVAAPRLTGSRRRARVVASSPDGALACVRRRERGEPADAARVLLFFVVMSVGAAAIGFGRRKMQEITATPERCSFTRTPMHPCTLLLTPQFLPDRVVSWEKAVCLLVLGKLEVLEEYDVPIRSPRLSLLTPAVARLVRGGKPGRRRILPFSRNNILRRDDFRCQYCGKRFAPKDLSLDHVVPRSRGGPRSFENIVACCFPCNAKKGNRTPEEARLPLLKRPVRPKVWTSAPSPLVLGMALAAGASLPGEWLPYLPGRG